MMLKVLVLALVVGVSLGWPISPVDDYLRDETMVMKVGCGEHITDFMMPKVPVRIVFDGSVDGVIPANCSIDIRLAELGSDFEKVSLWVTGAIDINDPGNNAVCTSSSFMVTDKDVDDDETGHSEKLCGQKDISFHYTEDIVKIILEIGSNGANGTGFDLLVEHHHVCGGKVEANRIISTPEFPEPYPKEFSCFWDIEGDSIELNFVEFDLHKEKKKDTLEVFAVDSKEYSGNKLRGKVLRFSGKVYLYFRSLTKNQHHTGFKCEVTIGSSEKRKFDLLSKFYRN